MPRSAQLHPALLGHPLGLGHRTLVTQVWRRGNESRSTLCHSGREGADRDSAPPVQITDGGAARRARFYRSWPQVEERRQEGWPLPPAATQCTLASQACTAHAPNPPCTGAPPCMHAATPLQPCMHAPSPTAPPPQPQRTTLRGWVTAICPSSASMASRRICEGEV